MNQNDWIYHIYANGEKIEETKFHGLADLACDTLELMGAYYELIEIYIGNNFDPVLHSPRKFRSGNHPPCPTIIEKCPYRKKSEDNVQSFFKPRSTSFRIESIDPQARCGFMLKVKSRGGNFWDYNFCIS